MKRVTAVSFVTHVNPATRRAKTATHVKRVIHVTLATLVKYVQHVSCVMLVKTMFPGVLRVILGVKSVLYVKLVMHVKPVMRVKTVIIAK